MIDKYTGLPTSTLISRRDSSKTSPKDKAELKKVIAIRTTPPKANKTFEDVPSNSTNAVPGAGDDNSTIIVDRRKNPKNGIKILKRFRKHANV